MNTGSISIDECRRLLAQGRSLNVIDVRTPGEFSRSHVAGAKLMPLDDLNPGAVVATRNGADDPIYVICQSGKRASLACQRLEQAGVTGTCCIEGGTDAWEKMGLPIERSGRGVISLERQTRIAAGLLVLIGAALTWLVHPAFLALPAFIGAGLVFAGVSDFCGMGILLGKMPWNR